MEDAYFDDPDDPEPKPRCPVVTSELPERAVPLFSQVRGGPDTCIGLERPIVLGRLVWRTVPKSHKSSGSPLTGLFNMLNYPTISKIMELTDQKPSLVLRHPAFHHLQPSISRAAR